MKSYFYLATKNLNKIKEVEKIMQLTNIAVLPTPSDIFFPEETGKTFEENALTKALHLKEKLHTEPVAGEDSGLEVDKLGGLPGVNSARFSGEHGNDQENIKKLLNLLSTYKNIEDRVAKFVTVIAFIDSKGIKIFKGEVLGFISFEPKGNNGFGYDPVFMVLPERKTFAQLTSVEKNIRSHRANAFKQLALYLQK
ncbi:RdgB/HAM1 family non-canonical purine NTP pyrophosphatase [bacterium]|nr:RdgB/HAM1 family non-canonical purine NTP pyrophosphatase [bacterium]